MTTRPWLRDVLAVLILCALTFALFAPLHGCATTPRQVASVSVVSLGSALLAIHHEHVRVFDRAADAIGARLADAGGTPADYDRESAPLVAAFRGRGEAIQALAAALYAAAAVIDASRGGNHPPPWLPAIGPIAEAIDRTLRVLRDGSLLPAIPIPPEVVAVSGTLRGLSGGIR